MYCVIHIQNYVYYPKFRHIQAYSRPIQIYSAILYHIQNSYSESWHIQNPKYIQNSVKEYSGIFRTLCNARILKTLPYSELWHIQDLRYIQNSVYLGTFMHIFNNDSYNSINFLFFPLILNTFQRNLKIHVFDYNDVNFNARLRLLK